jgi:hypothetical protein
MQRQGPAHHWAVVWLFYPTAALQKGVVALLPHFEADLSKAHYINMKVHKLWHFPVH